MTQAILLDRRKVGPMAGAFVPCLSLATRAALRDVAASLTFTQVSRVFRDEGFADYMLMATRGQPAAQSGWMAFLQGLAGASKFTDPKSVVDLYLQAVDWVSPAQTLAALRAIEELLWLFDRSGIARRTGIRFLEHACAAS